MCGRLLDLRDRMYVEVAELAWHQESGVRSQKGDTFLKLNSALAGMHSDFYLLYSEFCY
jgi:hypothetical protein